ncbi:EAL domain-containing protein [Deferribacteraceae bacterium V6Fe1]|nr:EAL domain-containing protein [Deferribacteraceae bacterium V6Fe1]
MNNERIFIGRQPIVDANQSIHGYELLFRDDKYNNLANIKDAFGSIATTLVNIFERFGTQSLLHNSLGFLNTNRDFLLSDYVEIIPKDKFVLEILEDTIVDDYLSSRICELKAMGYKFALDDFVFDSDYLDNFNKLFDKVDYIKVEYPNVKNDNLSLKLKILNKLPAKLLAEKVETYSEYSKCKDAGFHLFQGFFFARPTILEADAVDPSKLTVIKIINMINKDENVGKIVDVFQTNPILSYNFLKFVNSAAFFFRSRIKSIRHAISLIGLKKLQSWLMLLSFAQKGKNAVNSPLFQSAVVRAKGMELLATEVFKNNDEKKETAFLVGLFSLVDALFSRPKDELIKMLALDEEVEKALLFYEGPLGRMLKVIEYDEFELYDDMLKILNDLKIDYKDFTEIKQRSYAWLNEITEFL